MLMCGFMVELLAKLVCDGLVTAESEQHVAGRQPISVLKLKITETGRRAIESS
jgi:hypothetical protein